NGQTHPHPVQKCTNTKRRISMGTCIRKVVTATAAILALALLLPAPASAQSPANCNANLLDQTISRFPPDPTALPGDVIQYLIVAVNRSLQPPACDPADPHCHARCEPP